MDDEVGFAERMNSMPKYVVSSTLESADWSNSTILRDGWPPEVARLRRAVHRDILAACAILRRAFDLGITHFDLANNYGPPYGSAEENVGRLLSQDFRGHRDELVISTKAGYDMWPGPYGDWGSRKYLLASLDQSLRRM